ncbi:acyl-CoA desaturase [Aeoliella sp. SH292]|uniref:acyl-CoA desaturase n=1 Tax=Aeoliella sp. SH292 TaxID=3454464 RepID=UPI003F95E6AC
MPTNTIATPRPEVARGDSRRVPTVERPRLEAPRGTQWRIAWHYAAPIVVLHLLALLAVVPWLFSWTGVVVCVAGIYFYGGVGINLCYHRLLTHRSFACPQWLENFFILVAVCCLEDAPAAWVANHRLHHKDSDEQPDPHSPLVNFFWSHVGWLLVRNPERNTLTFYDLYARDILRKPICLWLQRRQNLLGVYFAHALLYFGIAWVVGGVLAGSWLAGLQLGCSVLLWGVILRTVFVWHITWSVNSMTHLWGYRNYGTAEESQNNWFVAFLSSGEGWHNNHHAHPTSASNWHRWWEIDGIWLLIVGLERMGLAWDVRYPRGSERHAAKVALSGSK